MIFTEKSAHFLRQQWSSSIMSQLLWRPKNERVIKSNMYSFLQYCEDESGIKLEDYQALHQFSVQEKERFWKDIIEYFKVKYIGDLDPVLLENNFDQYTWFSKTKLNFAENLLSNGYDEDVALNFQHESKLSYSLSYGELRKKSNQLAFYFKKHLQLQVGDVVAAYMPNLPETVLSMLASSTLGCTFTSTSCDFGVEGVLDRFSQSHPKVLVAAAGYEYGGKFFDQTEKLHQIEQRLEGLEKMIIVDFLNRGVDLSQFKKAILWSDCFDQHAEKVEFVPVPFAHPQYIMYSSGTTGKPKCIVHSVGGTLVQHIKELGLHSDLKREKKIFFFTTCGWMMWNWLVSSLYFGSEIVLYEGSPAYPDLEYFFTMIDRERINIFGTSPRFLKSLEDAQIKFHSSFPSLETLLSTGSPLLPEQYDFVYRSLKGDVLLASISGGTDIIGCFMLGNPMLPVYRGEIQSLGLGMDVKALDDQGEEAIGVEGELVCAQTFPSRPIYFLNDESQGKIKAAYFDQRPGYWTHGDFIKITSHYGVIVYGRSDATLNPGGVRIGTAEIYRQTESLDFIADSICVGKDVDGDVTVFLFVKLKMGELLDDEKIKLIKDLIRKNTTPRHVPRYVYAVDDIPYTRSGKKVELAVSRVINGRVVNNLEALTNPECLKQYESFR